MSASNQTLIEKADLALSEFTSGGGKLVEEQVKEFWRDAVLSSNFLQIVKTQPMKATEFQIPKAAMEEWVLVPGEERVALSEEDRSKVTPSKVTLSTRTFKAHTSLSYDQLEENVEGGSFMETVRQLLAQVAAMNMAAVCVQGDTTIVNPATKKQRALKKIDGILKQAATNTYDAGGARLGRPVLEAMYRKLPAQYADNGNLAFLTSKNASHDYAASLANRQTPKGDSVLERMAEEKYGRMPVVPIGVFPENLGGATNMTNVVLCDPKSIVIGLGKEITIETEKDAKSSEWNVIVRCKFDVKYIHEPAVVKATNVLAAA
jgi:hypothetical protein